MGTRRERRGWSMLGRPGDARPGAGAVEPLAADVRDDDPDDDDLQRDAEESFVAALQESDTAIEVLHDQGHDAPKDSRSRWALGAMGLVLALGALLLARRRS